MMLGLADIKDWLKQLDVVSVSDLQKMSVKELNIRNRSEGIE